MHKEGKSSSTEFLPALESARGIAALMVVIYHFAKASGGQDLREICRNFYLAVDLFFVLSGFIMTKIYWDKIITNNHLVKFIILRLGRIYPLHLFWVCVFLIYFLILQHGRLVQEQAAAFWPTVLLVQSINALDYITPFNYPSWSISAEWLAYLIFGVHLLLFRNLPKLINLGLVTFMILICYFLAFNFRGELGLDLTYHGGFLRGIAGFYLGIITFFLFNYFGKIKYIEYIFIVIAGFLYFNESRSLYDYGFPILAAGAVLWLASKEAQSSLLAHHFLVKLGTISYSIYLGHLLVGMITQRVCHKAVGANTVEYYFYLILLLKLLLTYGVALFTYKFIEQPCRTKAKFWVQNYFG
jgi:peptidoglycan/LPS O-acetylase OafA/YrhL